MRPFILAGFALLAAMPLAAQTTPTSAPAANPKSITLPPELDRVLRDYERGWRAGDAGAVAALFSDDGYALSNGKPPAQGPAAIRDVYAGAGGNLHLRAFGYAVGDSVGYILGAYRYAPEGADVGKFVLALRRKGGGAWLIAADMDNANERPRRPASPSR